MYPTSFPLKAPSGCIVAQITHPYEIPMKLEIFEALFFRQIRATLALHEV